MLFWDSTGGEVTKMLQNDSLANVLYVDLSRRSFKIRPRQDLFELYIGGAGVAIQLLHEECPADSDPFDPGNPVVFAVGPLTGFFPWLQRPWPCLNPRSQVTWGRAIVGAEAP